MLLGPLQCGSQQDVPHVNSVCTQAGCCLLSWALGTACGARIQNLQDRCCWSRFLALLWPCILQDASVVNNDPALIKAAAAGQLELTSGLAGSSSSSNSLKHSGSLIGTAIQITAGSPSSSGVLDEAIAAQ